ALPICLMSPYDALKNENKAGKIGDLISPFLYPIEKYILKYSDLILTDTQLNREFFINTFYVNHNKIKAIYVGANEDLNFYDNKINNKDNLQVIFYGSFLPLHGMDVILQAIHRLRDKPIHFTLIGGKGNSLKQFEKTKKALGLQRITHIKWVEFSELCRRYIAKTDIFLGGPFGGTGQAQRVITGKTFQGLAMAKATIIGKIKEPVGFKDKVNCLMVEQNNSEQLANAILWAYEHRDKLENIGQHGWHLYQNKFSVTHIAKTLNEILL
ncbi:MAG: glycosyltransferase, partial [Candidatus Parabeggiatoa sp.]|nr:glycosyltransferase [Candidatus Parabeggiatoa sp.]